MKEFKEHTSCPECGSKDNLGIWTDGQKWCFGCGYYVPAGTGLSVTELHKRINEQQQKRKYTKSAHVTLPYDFTLVLPKQAEAWLEKYGITDEERYHYKLGWSEFYESMVLPAFDLYGNLLVVQRRYFGTEKFPKYHTKGNPESVIWSVHPRCGADRSRTDPTDTYNGDIVLVEDFLSAIKVGRHMEAMPLWGSHLSLPQLTRLAARWQKIVLWLDPDKTVEAVKFRYKCLPYFKYASVIASDKDPKDYDDERIKAFLLEA